MGDRSGRASGAPGIATPVARSVIARRTFRRRGSGVAKCMASPSCGRGGSRDIGIAAANFVSKFRRHRNVCARSMDARSNPAVGVMAATQPGAVCATTAVRDTCWRRSATTSACEGKRRSGAEPQRNDELRSDARMQPCASGCVRMSPRIAWRVRAGSALVHRQMHRVRYLNAFKAEPSHYTRFRKFLVTISNIWSAFAFV